MLLVLIILGIIIILVIAIIIIIFATIKIEIKNLKINSEASKNKKEYKIKIMLYIFKKIKIVSFTLDSKKVKQINKKIRQNNKIKELENKFPKEIINKKSRKFILQAIKNMKIKIENMNLKIYIGLEDAMATSFLSAGVASAIGIIYPHLIKQKNKNNCTFFVNPIYQNKNMYYISLDISIVVEIINVINELKRKNSTKK